MDCTSDKSKISKQQAIVDYESGGGKSLTYCYCTFKFTSRLNELFDTSKGSKKLCFSIYDDILKQTGFSFLIALILTIGSYIIDATLVGLSRFEKYTDLNMEYASRILKGFLMKYANSGLLIMVINLRVKIFSNEPFGKYDDLTPNWYVTVGYSVVFAYLLKFIALIVFTFLRVFLPCMSRCCDRGCSSDISKTKKKSMGQYINLYAGPLFDIDNSYTEILKTVFVMATFGPMMPIIYFISMVHIGLLFLRDKILSTYLRRLILR